MSRAWPGVRVLGACLGIVMGAPACGGDDAMRSPGLGSETTTTAPQTSTAGDASGGTATTQMSTATSGSSVSGATDTDTHADTDTNADDSTAGTGDPPTLDPYPDLSLGPYPSLLQMARDSMLSNATSLDTSETYGHSAAQGYLLQAIATLLWDARDHDLEGHDALVDAALGEIDELQLAADEVVGGGPAFGLDEAWDAFGDGSTNPAFTAYTWQSGMVALGVAKMARVLDEEQHPQAAAVRDFGIALVERWDAHYTDVADGGYWWYSTASADAIAVHNTSALVAMAAVTLEDAGAPAGFGDRAQDVAALLWARMSGNPSTGYSWNYADDGYPVAQRRPEDVSHALVTLQLMREARARRWWSATQAQGVAQTLRTRMWSDHPARLHGFVDGSDGGDSEWAWSRAAVIGYAAHGDTPGGDAAVFEVARSLMFSSYLSRFERAFEGATVDAARTLALALMLAHRPDGLDAGATWQMEAGPGDDAPSPATGGVRFYTVDWDAPADTAYGLELRARTSSAVNANVLVDVPDDRADTRVIVSLTYASADNGMLEQWNGSAFVPLAALPATRDDEGTLRWMRTSVELAADRTDYQPPVRGTNVLLQTTNPAIAVSRIEATVLP